MIKIFKNIEEIKPYYKEKTNTYEFIENGRPIDIIIDFDLYITSHIYAKGINAKNISARNISVWDISAGDIKARGINARDIKAWDISAKNISARDISARNISVWNVSVWDISAKDIRAENIKANNIRYNSVCYARSEFVCNSIKGTRKNSKYFCLDSDVVIKGDKKNVK